MAKKAYRVVQTYKYAGEQRTVTLTYECEEAELTAIVGLLEGKVQVFEENVTLSSPDTQSEVITGGIPIKNVAMSHSGAKTKYFGAYNRSIIFKSSTSFVAIQAAFELHKPYDAPFDTEKPDRAYPQMGQFLD